MQRLRLLVSHPLTASGLRYAVAGAIVASVYVAIPVGLNGEAGVPIEAAIPVAYLLAVTLHFNLQRHFVFRHVAEFALSRRQQIGRYVGAGAIQYPTTAAATALLPELFGVSQRVTFVAVTLTMSLAFFVILRTHIFHADESDAGVVAPADAIRSGDEPQVAEQQFLHAGGSLDECDAHPVKAQVQEDR